MRQYLAGLTASEGRRPWERPLKLGRDRLLLVVTADSSRTMAERPPRGAVRDILALIRVVVLDLGPEGRAAASATSMLADVVLQDWKQAATAWSTLVATCLGYSAERSGGGRPELQQALTQHGIRLRAVPSYRGDIERLIRYSERLTDAQRGLSEIRVGRVPLKIQRPVVTALRGAAAVGEGSGTDSVGEEGISGEGRSGTIEQEDVGTSGEAGEGAQGTPSGAMSGGIGEEEGASDAATMGTEGTSGQAGQERKAQHSKSTMAASRTCRYFIVLGGQKNDRVGGGWRGKKSSFRSGGTRPAARQRMLATMPEEKRPFSFQFQRILRKMARMPRRRR